MTAGPVRAGRVPRDGSEVIESTNTRSNVPAGRRRRRWPAVVALALLALLAAVALGHRLWLPPIARVLVVDDGVAPADFVLPLAGNLERYAFAADLVMAGYGQRLLVTPLPLDDEIERERYVRQVTGVAARRGLGDERMTVIPDPSPTTHAEARTVLRFLGPHESRTVLVVTSPSHTRRSHWIFNEVFRDTAVDVRVVPVPAGVYEHDRHPFDPDTWWTTPRGRSSVVSEYLKLTAHLLGVR